MSERQVVVYSAANRLQAALLQQMLDEHGIAALVVNDGLTGEGGELPDDMSTTSLVGGGLIAGDSIAALVLGIIGLLSLVK